MIQISQLGKIQLNTDCLYKKKKIADRASPCVTRHLCKYNSLVEIELAVINI